MKWIKKNWKLPTGFMLIIVFILGMAYVGGKTADQTILVSTVLIGMSGVITGMFLLVAWTTKKWASNHTLSG